MTSLRSQEGYMFIDHSNSPGMDDAMMVKMGYPSGAGKGIFESATYTCSHCNAVVVIEPKRTRERGYCKGCGQRICDSCNIVKEQTLTCCSMQRVIEEMQEQDAKQVGSQSPIILLS